VADHPAEGSLRRLAPLLSIKGGRPRRMPGKRWHSFIRNTDCINLHAPAEADTGT